MGKLRRLSPICPECHLGRPIAHCTSPTCTWWACPHCHYYGDDTNRSQHSPFGPLGKVT